MTDLSTSRATMAQIVGSGQSVFAPPMNEGCRWVFTDCTDPDCRQDCGARRSEIPLITIVDAPVARISERVLIAAIIIFAVLGGIVGHGAIERQDHAYQTTRV